MTSIASASSFFSPLLFVKIFLLRHLLIRFPWLQDPAGVSALVARSQLDIWVSYTDLRSLSAGSHSWPLILISPEVEPAGGRNRDKPGGAEGGGRGYDFLAM